MTTTIHFVKVPAGRGKTRRYALPRLRRGNAIYVTPTKRLLTDMGSMLNEGKERAFARLTSWQQIDSDSAGMPVAKRVAQYFSTDSDIVLRTLTDMTPLGITTACMSALPPEVVAGRELIIDETPPCVQVRSARAGIWNALLQAKFIAATDGATAADGDKFPIKVGMTLSLEVNGREGSAVWSGDNLLDTEVRDLLRFIDARPTRIASSYGKHLYAVQELNPEIFRAASNVTILSASLDGGYFLEWAKFHGFSVMRAEHTLDTSPVVCQNVEIFYALDSKLPGSKALLDRHKDQLSRLSEQALQPSKNGSFAGSQSDKAIGFFNEGGVKPPKRVISLSPGTLGRNEFRDSTCVLYLAATQAGPGELGAVQAHFGMTDRLSPTHRHYEAMYQGVMRSALREDNNANVKILVPTKKDAEVLKMRLGATKPVQHCCPKIRIDK